MHIEIESRRTILQQKNRTSFILIYVYLFFISVKLTYIFLPRIYHNSSLLLLISASTIFLDIILVIMMLLKNAFSKSIGYDDNKFFITFYKPLKDAPKDLIVGIYFSFIIPIIGIVINGSEGLGYGIFIIFDYIASVYLISINRKGRVGLTFTPKI
jgi:hypothetical protein